MLLKPLAFRPQCLTAMLEGAEFRPTYRTQVGDPSTVRVRFDMGGSRNPQFSKGEQIDRLVVQALNVPTRMNNQLHRFLLPHSVSSGTTETYGMA